MIIAIGERLRGSCLRQRSRSSCWWRSYRLEFTTSSNMRISRTRSRKGSASRLRRSSLFGVSLAVILVMTIVSGGDAIFGELPFTLAGFLIFFVIFWLMIAWIF